MAEMDEVPVGHTALTVEYWHMDVAYPASVDLR
jgi:hypothetical protein